MRKISNADLLDVATYNSDIKTLADRVADIVRKNPLLLLSSSAGIFESTRRFEAAQREFSKAMFPADFSKPKLWCSAEFRLDEFQPSESDEDLKKRLKAEGKARFRSFVSEKAGGLRRTLRRRFGMS